MTVHTYGLEFETIGLTTRNAAHAITAAGISCDGQRYNHETSSVWKAVPDASLNGDISAEIVSPILLTERLNEARTVSRALLAAGARVNRSTGFHVHMGADRIGLRKPLANLVVNYYTVHEIFANLVAPKRTECTSASHDRYCRECSIRWAKALTLEQAHETADCLNNGNFGFADVDRYYSLNLNSVDRHGTIEFRLHQGTLNASKALAWVNFLTSMVNYSMDGRHLPAEWYGLGKAESMVKLPNLLTLMRECGMSDSTYDYLLRRADELAGRG